MSLRTSKGSSVLRVGAAAAVVLAVALPWIRARAGGAVALPAPAVDTARDAKPGKQTVVFAGGCFWGVQAVFQHVKGVVDATSGFRMTFWSKTCWSFECITLTRTSATRRRPPARLAFATGSGCGANDVVPRGSIPRRSPSDRV